MEARKIQFTGRSTFVVSLPKRWVEAKNLRAGDYLYIEEKEEDLVLSAQQTEREEGVSKDVEITGLAPKEIERLLVAHYISGFDLLNLRAKRISPEQREAVNSTLRYLIGPEIMGETSEYITLQNFLDTSDLSPRNVLRRMHLIAASMLKSAVEAFLKGDGDLARDVIGRDMEVDKLCLLVQRELTEGVTGRASHLEISPEESLQYFAVTRSIERIADHAAKIATAAIAIREIPSEMERDITQLYDKALEVFNGAVEAFFRGDEKLANRVLDSDADIQGLVSAALRHIEAPPANTLPFFTIVDSLHRVTGYSMDIAEGALDLEAI